MRAIQYRRLVSVVSCQLTSLPLCKGSHEQRVHLQRLKEMVEELRQAKPHHLTSYQQVFFGNRLIYRCDQAIKDKEAEFRRADANLQNMAFGGEWK